MRPPKDDLLIICLLKVKTNILKHTRSVRIHSRNISTCNMRFEVAAQQSALRLQSCRNHENWNNNSHVFNLHEVTGSVDQHET